MFNDATVRQLKLIGVDVDLYWSDISKRFGNTNAKYIDTLIADFNSTHSGENNEWYCSFLKHRNITDENSIKQHLYAFYSCLIEFEGSGRHGFFEYRTAEEYVPNITLQSQDITKEWDKKALDDEVVIYRGMSEKEFLDKNFTQHWTTNKETAHSFAFRTYEDFEKKDRVLVEAKVKKENVIYCDSIKEYEIIPKAPVAENIFDLKKLPK